MMLHHHGLDHAKKIWPQIYLNSLQASRLQETAISEYLPKEDGLLMTIERKDVEKEAATIWLTWKYPQLLSDNQID